MSKHSAAPWNLTSLTVAEDVMHDSGATIHTNFSGFINMRLSVRSEAEANARLIAAAPDLLEALKELLRVVNLPETNAEGAESNYAELLAAEDIAKAAIAKATAHSHESKKNEAQPEPA